MIHRGHQDSFDQWSPDLLRNFQEITEQMWNFFPSLIFFASSLYVIECYALRKSPQTTKCERFWECFANIFPLKKTADPKYLSTDILLQHRRFLYHFWRSQKVISGHQVLQILSYKIDTSNCLCFGNFWGALVLRNCGQLNWLWQTTKVTTFLQFGDIILMQGFINLFAQWSPVNSKRLILSRGPVYTISTLYT